MFSAGYQLLKCCHHLATIAHPEREDLLPGEKGLKLLAHPRLKQDGFCPALPRPQDIPERKPATGGKALKRFKMLTPGLKVRHRHVHRPESGPIKCGGHFHMAVNPLFAQDGHTRTCAAQDSLGGRIGRQIKGQLSAEARV